jgi:hypothetical protein
MGTRLSNIEAIGKEAALVIDLLKIDDKCPRNSGLQVNHRRSLHDGRRRGEQATDEFDA